MQYIGQTCSLLKVSKYATQYKHLFSEQYRRMKKPGEIDRIHYRYFKQNIYYYSLISIQPVQRILYYDNSTKTYRNILRHELELKW